MTAIKSATTRTENFQSLKAGDLYRREPWQGFRLVARNDGSQIILTDYSTFKITEDNKWDAVEVLKIEFA